MPTEETSDQAPTPDTDSGIGTTTEESEQSPNEPAGLSDDNDAGGKRSATLAGRFQPADGCARWIWCGGDWS